MKLVDKKVAGRLNNHDFVYFWNHGNGWQQVIWYLHLF